MSGSGASKFRRALIAIKTPTPNQSTSTLKVDGSEMAGASVPRKGSTPKTPSPNTIVKTPSIHSLKIPPPIETSSSQAASMDSHSYSPTLVIPGEEKANISNQNLYETEGAQVILLKEKTEIDKCPICLDDCTKPKQLDKCSHTFCTDCIDHYFQAIKPQCPCCFTIYGELWGNQPDDGTMTYTVMNSRLPGFERSSIGTIKITYHFPNGIQNEKHPNPNTPYYGTIREAYLPDNADGRHVLKLLQTAFNFRQIFTIGQSRTTGYDNVVTWNDIHHKTNTHGGMENFGYPDKTYLNRVQQELASKGIK